MKARRISGAWPRVEVAARTTRTKAVAAPRRRPTPGLEALAGRPHRHPRQLVVEVDGGGNALPEVAEVEALVLGMRVARGVLDPGEQAGRAAEQIGEGLHEPDRSARPDHRRLFLEAGLEGAAGRLEGGSVGVGRPPGRGPVDGRADVHAVRRFARELPDQELTRLAAVHVGNGAEA